MPAPIDPLPITVAPYEGEAGMSFVLRAFGANGLAIGQVNKWLGFRVAHRLSTAQVRLLAWVTDCSAAWLHSRLLQVQHDHGMAVWTYLGHRFLPGPWSRDRLAAICPGCLNEKGFCHAAWGISAFCACPEHGYPLIDHCSHCHAPITWNRPAADVCICRRPFVAPRNAQADAGLHASIMSAWIRQRLAADTGRGTDTPLSLPLWLAHLSIDGTLRIMQAFGLLTHPLQAPTAADIQRIRSPAEVCAMVDRAVDRLLRFDAAPDMHLTLSAEIHLPGIQVVAERGLTDADRRTAVQILSRLTPQTKRRVPAGRGRPLQWNLFDLDGPHA